MTITWDFLSTLYTYGCVGYCTVSLVFWLADKIAGLRGALR